MLFWLFLKKCRKYKFCYSLNNVNGLTIMLKPHYSFENIEVHDCNYKHLFIKAIKEMKKYYRTHN